MSIYKKLARVQMELMDMEIPKSGWNNFRKYHYYELDDLLPRIFKACFKEQITVYFTFNNDEGVLHLKSWEKEGQVGTRDELSVRVPFPELNKGNNNDVIQDIGKSITYLKRYLLMNTFLITEYDKIDSSGECECECDCKEKTSAKSKNAPVKKGAKKGSSAKNKTDDDATDGIPPSVRAAGNLCKLKYREITEEGIIENLAELRTKGKIDKKKEESLVAYAKTHFDDIVKELAA